ncbi:hypothetical protein ABIC16_002642 [Sphingomonas sp. PvP055]|uniref:hypothetical protein n=1 Tax=Sphingomonas sp. PvP055 TaxID=3156391 RepID=UPI00339AB2E8
MYHRPRLFVERHPPDEIRRARRGRSPPVLERRQPPVAIEIAKAQAVPHQHGDVAIRQHGLALPRRSGRRRERRCDPGQQDRGARPSAWGPPDQNRAPNVTPA